MEKDIQIERFSNNPLITPDQSKQWMSKAVFNCGVVRDHDVYKMLFRAARTEDLSESNLGLALSPDGRKWYVVDKPVLESGFNIYCERGIEDPRIIKWIDGWWYIFATALSWYGPRISIWRTKNFFEFEWIGVPFDGHDDKNASVFPELIDGWVYLIDRYWPDMWISRTKDLSLRTGWQDHQVLVKASQFYSSPYTKLMPRNIGIGGPPVKTPKGWLVITHTVHSEGEYDGRLYTLGFCVLDLTDPRKVNYIHPKPILWPHDPWEKEGYVKNVVFSCAIVDNPDGDEFYIYWGGADTVICGGRLKKKDLEGICY